MTLLPQSPVAAFFDLDGTLLAPPSLEAHFFAWLRRRRALPAANYIAWLAEAIRIAPQGFAAIRYANKMYLRGISYEELTKPGKKGHATLPAPSFLPDALARLTWHAHHGHSIFLITGTLEPLASEIAQAITALLAVRGIPACVGLRATRLQENNGRWTGEIAGAPMFGRSKATAIRQLATEMSLDLTRSYAYADSFTDRHMLELVGHPSAVNPSFRLGRLARNRRWPILRWLAQKKSRPSAEAITQRCSSGLVFRPEAFRQHQQDSAMEKVV